MSEDAFRLTYCSTVIPCHAAIGALVRFISANEGAVE